MEIRPDERPERQQPRSKAGVWIALVIAAALIGGGAYYLLSGGNAPEEEPTAAIEFEPEPLPAPPATPAPLPEVKEEIPPQAPPPEVKKVPLPSLDESDKLAREKLAELTPDGKLELWLPGDFILRRGTTLVDGLSRGIVLRKMLNAPAPEGKFAVLKDGAKISIDSANYQRYNYLVETLEALDTDSIVGLFHFLRPLLEQAYGELGYPPEKVDKAFIAALDQILATPFPLQPVYLTQESVNYKFADPSLEALSPLQKQLVRMGPTNTKRVQDKARAIREALLK
ncbi:DUF3014 domain-containing protein [Porticoccus litoralis]|uniref:DUF3014 domain-containing protein n=1 Tax=Porticoccus litoralis TaxID=434086 RepID=A0AAW8B215_9GAMM|nr:DUF3014 domain-containing protein [Porticoccus litoralis]MDP1519952.1 DUF3014 domain-containing protein [Porticoccus litoralis]